MFGILTKVLHDLGDAMTAACQQLWKGRVPRGVCHFHLLWDIGEDLYAKPQAALRELVRSLKLQPRLKEQRRGQTQWLRQHIEDPTALARLLHGATVEVPSDVLGRELLLAFHQWILDYPSDGRRQGFPFDPYLLYSHRRVVRAVTAVGRLLEEPAVKTLAPPVPRNFSQMLTDYLTNPKVSTAAEDYERACELFTRLRTVLCIDARGESPLYGPYRLDGEQTSVLRQSLEQLRQECRESSLHQTDPKDAQRHRIVFEHLDRYWPMLFADEEERGRVPSGPPTASKDTGELQSEAVVSNTAVAS